MVRMRRELLMLKDIILALIAILGPIISGIWAYKSSVKKSVADLEAVREKNKAEIEAIKIQSENEIAKIKEQALAEARLHEDKAKIDLATRQFENPAIQGLMGNMIGSVMEKALEKEMKKHFDEKE